MLWAGPDAHSGIKQSQYRIQLSY